MNKKSLFKKLTATVLTGIMTLSTIPMAGVSAAESQLSAEAAFGTPVIDGQVDKIWDNTNYNAIERVSSQGGGDAYKGWFKVLWDNDNMYVLARIYSKVLTTANPNAWDNDSFEVFIDEKNDHTTNYNEDDYQLRSDYKGYKTGTNYDFTKLKAVGNEQEDGYYLEMAFPLVTETLTEGKVMGFDVQVNAAETLAVPKQVYRWSERVAPIYSNNSTMGSVVLKKNVNIKGFNEPEYVNPVAKYSDSNEPETFEMVNGVTTTFDGKTFNYPILHITEYPAMAIEDLADVIGASVENGDTIVKDEYKLTFEDGNRLAKDEKGHFMLERKSKRWTDGRLYIPVSFVKPYLTYNMHYNRFDKVLNITSGTNYPQEAEVVFYARDFGAVGDGKHKDGAPILKALNAAMSSGVPSRVELDAGKTYLLEERVDNWSYFMIEETDNLTFEGNGATLLMEKPVNTFMQIMSGKNIKIKNMNVDAKEACSSWGTIVSVNKDNGSFDVDIADGVPTPADDDWVHYYNVDARSGGWWFGQLYDPVLPRLKFTGCDNLFVDKIESVKDRIYRCYILRGKDGNAKWAEVGDRFVINTRHSAYDLKDANARQSGSFSAIWLDQTSDILFENVYVYSTGWMFCGIGLSEGKTTFRNSGFKTRDGVMLAANSDGIHTWLNRGSLVLEDCTFMNNLDDHFNTYNQGGFVEEIIDSHTFKTHHEVNARVGDELQVYNPSTKTYLGRAFVKECEKIAGSNKWILTLDRDFENIESSKNVSNPTILYNMDSGSRGNSIRNCTFMYSRRYPILNRAANSLFEDCKVIDCGAGFAFMNELTTATKSEGGFPCSNTMRNVDIKCESSTSGYYPLEIRHWQSTLGDSAPIDGILLENNTIDVGNTNGLMFINAVKDLHMINNKIVNTKNATKKTTPIIITNCDISLIDGIEAEFNEDPTTLITIMGSKVNEENIKNINIKNKTTKKYTIE